MPQDPKSEVARTRLQIAFPREIFEEELPETPGPEARDRTSPSEIPRQRTAPQEMKGGSPSPVSQRAVDSPARPGTREDVCFSQRRSERKETPSPPTEDRPRTKRKGYSLMDKVYSPENLRSAFDRVKANNGASGIDGMTVKRFAEGAEQRLKALAEDLRRKTYRPQPVRRVYIPKSGGGQRPLGIPTVRDRIVQQALLQILGPIFEAKFRPQSHGFRPQRGCATALKVVDRVIGLGYSWVVDADIATFFDTVNHDRLIAEVNEEVSDGSVLRLIRRILEAGVIEPAVDEVEPTEEGTPQGGPLSPLLANLYLHPFDERMIEAGWGLVRYADDFVLFTRSQETANAALALARTVLEDELGLRLHPEKTRVVSVTEGFEFLGYHYFRSPTTGALRKAVRRKSVQRFRDAIRQRTPRLRNQRKPKANSRTLAVSQLKENPRATDMIGSLNRYLRGWHVYFKGVNGLSQYPFRNFDEFVRRRVRSALTGRTGSGGWNARLSNERLRLLGLLRLDDLHQTYLAQR